MDGQPRHESAEGEAYRRRARLHDRLARAYEESANLHEYYASRCFYEDFADEALRHADRAREAAARSRVRSDDLCARRV